MFQGKNSGEGYREEDKRKGKGKYKRGSSSKFSGNSRTEADYSSKPSTSYPFFSSSSKINQAKCFIAEEALAQAQPLTLDASTPAELMEMVEGYAQETKTFSPPKEVNIDLLTRIGNLKTWLVKANHNTAVIFFNRCLQNGYFLPLDFLKVIIKKYGNSRFGTEEEAERIYEQARKLYADDQYRTSLVEFVGDLMLIYIYRLANRVKTNVFSPSVEQKLIQLYEPNKGIYTFNVLFKMYLDAKEVEKASLLLENNNIDITEDMYDDWTYQYLLIYYNSTRGKQAALEFFKTTILNQYNLLSKCVPSIVCEEIITMVDFDDAIDLYYNVFSAEMRRHEKVQRELIKILKKKSRYVEAWEIFRGMDTPVEPTFTVVITMLASNGMIDLAEEILSLAVEKYGFYSGIEPKFMGRSISIDFHSFLVRGGGTPTYSAYNKECLKVILYRFVKILSEKYASNAISLPQNIEFICGKGKFETRDFIVGFLKDNLNWHAFPDRNNPGKISFNFTARHAQAIDPFLNKFDSEKNSLPLREEIEKFFQDSRSSNEKETLFSSVEVMASEDKEAVEPADMGLDKIQISYDKNDDKGESSGSGYNMRKGF